MNYVAVTCKIKHSKNLLLLQALLIYFDPIIQKEHLYFGSSEFVCDMVAWWQGKTIFFSVRDILTSQGILVWVRENLTLSKKSEGGEI